MTTTWSNYGDFKYNKLGELTVLNQKRGKENEKKMETQQAAGRPALKKKAGAITISCWENTGKGMDGQPTTFISLSIQRTYKDRQGNWAHATNYRIGDIPKIQICLDEVYRHYVLKEVDTETPTASVQAGLKPVRREHW